MNKREKEIYRAFDGKLVGKFFMKKMVCEVVSKLPDQIGKFIIKKCWFISSMDDAWGFVFTGRDIKDQHLIFLSDDLFIQGRQQIHYSIAHEIGHVILKHRNSVLVEQSKEEIRKQENEANQFARQLINQ